MGGTLEQAASEVCGSLISQSHTHCACMDTGFCLQVSDQAI